LIRALVVVAVLVASTALGHAAEPQNQVSPKRAVPDYDGVPDPPPSTTEVVAWFPRVVFFPVWLVTEFVVRRPLGWLVVTAERGNWPSEIISFFTFGGQKNVGIVPTTYVDLGFQPTVGFYFFWDEFIHPRHGLRLRVSVWSDGYTFSMANRIRVGEASRLQLRTTATRVPDAAFYGIGPRTLDEDLSRFGLDTLLAELSFRGRLSYGENLLFALTVRNHDFRDPKCCDVPLAEAEAMGLYPTPTGFAEGGYTAVVGHVEATADSRYPFPRNQTGARVALGVDVGAATEGLGSWIKGFGTAGLFWDVGNTRRVLGLTASAAMIEPLGGEDDVPFLELVDFGGGAAMPGFRPGRLQGRSGLSASLRYEWPVWAALAGSLQVEIGNVFGPRFEDFDAGLLRLSTALGLRSMGANDHELQFILGIGTETFDHGTELTSIRLGIGGTYGF
jgi:hypothetical protein